MGSGGGESSVTLSPIAYDRLNDPRICRKIGARYDSGRRLLSLGPGIGTAMSILPQMRVLYERGRLSCRGAKLSGAILFEYAL